MLTSPSAQAGPSSSYAAVQGRTVFWITFALMAALSTLWALASPVFSIPDESAHAVKAIAQVRGEVIGHKVPGVKHLVVDLPAEYRYSPQILCFAFHSQIPADCGVELGAASGTSTFNTWVGAYNPLYYYLVGWPSLIFDGSAGIYAMRIASALLGSLFIAFAFQAAMAGIRSRWMPLGIAFAAAPMTVYLLGAVNPNGAEIAAAVALWATLPRLLDSFGGPERSRPRTLPQWYLWLIVALSSIVLVTARALGPLWLVVVVALCFVVSGWGPVRSLFTTARSYRWLALVAAAGLFSVLWTLGGGSLSSQAERSDAPLVGASFLQGFIYVVRGTPEFLHQALGYFGWFDAPLPVWAYWPAVTAFGVLVVVAFSAVRWRSVLALATVVAAALLVPALVQGYSVSQTGIIWQGRYALFLYMGIVIIAAWLLSGPDGRQVDSLSERITWIGAALIALYGALAYWFVMQRYVIGDAVPIGQMWKDPAWQPPLGWPVLVTGYVVVSVAFVFVVGRLARQAATAESLHADEPASILMPSLGRSRD